MTTDPPCGLCEFPRLTDQQIDELYRQACPTTDHQRERFILIVRMARDLKRDIVTTEYHRTID